MARKPPRVADHKKGHRGQPRNKARQAVRLGILRFTRNFLIAAAVTIIPVSLVPEAWYAPINRATAFLSGEMLQLATLAPMVQGSFIRLNGFSVNVIAECSAIHLVALFGAFIVAFPARRAQRWVGFVTGAAVLLLANVVRIAAVTWIGYRFPALFEPIHVYLGQLGMLLLTIVICLRWCQWAADPSGMENVTGFILRFILFSSPLFLLWLPVNREYVAMLDRFIQWLFHIAAHPIVIPRTHQLYYQTFSLVTLIGLLMAIKGVDLPQRIRWIVVGITVLSFLLFFFRLCNVWISAYSLQWAVPVSQLIYALCVYALPLVIVLRFVTVVQMQQKVV